MTKQLLIYGNVQPVSLKRHHNWSVRAGDDYEFGRKINSAPVMAAEFPKICSDYAVVFTGNDDTIMPVVIMGFRSEENLYIDARGKWTTGYIPAFLRRYPFIFSSSDNGKSFTLCIDEEFAGCNQEGSGEKLFDAEGNQTQYLKNVLDFLKEYQVHYKRTERFSKKLRELSLLEPMTAQFTLHDGSKANLTGFMAINREKLKTLSGEQLQQLAVTDELELIYIHIQSLQNFSRVIGKLSNTTNNDPEQAENSKVSDARTSKKLVKKSPAPVSKRRTEKKKGPTIKRDNVKK